MQHECPYCGAPKSSQGRRYECGTSYSGRGDEYRTVACRRSEQWKLQAEHWAEVASRAEASKLLAEHDAILARDEAARDRLFAQQYHDRLEQEMKTYREKIMNELSTLINSIT